GRARKNLDQRGAPPLSTRKSASPTSREAVAACEEVKGHGAAGQNDNASDDPWVQLAAHSRSRIPAHDGTGEHEKRLRPDNRTRYDEDHHRNPVDDADEQRLEAVHHMNVIQTHQPEHGQHQDADTSPKEAPIGRDRQLSERQSGQDTPRGFAYLPLM